MARQGVALGVAIGLVLTLPGALVEGFEIPETGRGLPGVVRVHGDLLLIRQQTGFEVLSLADSGNPNPVARYTGAAKTYDLDVVGDLVLLTNVAGQLDGELIVVSLAQPLQPAELSRIGTSAHIALAAEPAGAWTIDGNAGSLRHINLSDPYNPFEDAFHDNVQAWDVLRWQDFLLIAGTTGGFEVTDVGPMGSLARVASVRLPGVGNGIAARGRLAAVRTMTPSVTWDTTYGLGLFDLADPARPVVLHEWPETVNDPFVDFSLGECYLVVASRERGVGFAAIDNPLSPGELEFVALGHPPMALDAGREHVYVLTEAGNLEVVSVPACRSRGGWRSHATE